jgi:tetratricopeptide (TPR) repeat protein
MNYHSLFSTLSLALLLQVSSTFLLSSCSTQKPLQQNSSPTSSQVEPQENLTGISKTIQDKAKQFTVRIDYPDGNGSGVIVAKNGETYYVLTAKHVVEQDQEYKLVTPDEKEYTVDAGNIKTLEGADLAVLQFQSEATYQLATLAEYKRETQEIWENDQMALSKATSLEEYEKQVQEHEKQMQEDIEKSKELQFNFPWLFVFGWQRLNNIPQLRLTAGRDSTERSPDNYGGNRASFASHNFDSLASSNSYQLSYTNFSQGGMSGGAVLDTLGRVVGIHAATEGERAGLEEIQLGYGLGIPIKTFLSSTAQVGIKPEWLKVEKVRPQRITKADEQSITKNLLEIEPPDNNATEADWLNYGNDLWRIKRYQEATVAFDEAIKRKPDFYQAYFGKGLAIKTQTLERSLQEISPVSPSEELPSETSSMQEFDVQEYEEQTKELPSIQEPDFEEQMQERRERMEEESEELVEEGIQKMNETMQEFNQELISYNQTFNQRWAKALPFLKKATEINPDFYPAWREIGMIKYQEMYYLSLSVPDLSGRSEVTELNSNPTLSPKATLAAHEALAAFNKATAINPSDAELYNWKGVVLQRLSRHQEAIEAFSRAIQINPLPLYYNFRLQSYCALGNKREAEADMKIADAIATNLVKGVSVCGY